jgi:orotate phosphoribosyltransferase
MEPLRSSGDMLSVRPRAFRIIAERSFRRGKFTLASGRESNFYLDMKPTMFHPEGANLLSLLVLERIKDLRADYIGGLEMGAVPLVTAVSLVSFQQGRPLPGFFVRKEVKGHGTKKKIEAATDLPGKQVVILEDVTTTGGSAMQAVEAVRDAGGSALMVLSIVDREEGAAEFYKNQNLPFDALFRVSEFLSAS